MDVLDTLQEKYAHAKEMVHEVMKNGAKHPVIELNRMASSMPLILPGICYLSHPYRRPRDNVLQAGEIARQLQQRLTRGCTVLSLIHNWPFGCPEVTADKIYWMELYHSLQVMEACQTVFMAPGWENCFGCCVEYLYAIEMGKPIFIVIIKEEIK